MSCVCNNPECQIAYGICHCGCGNKVPLSLRDRPEYGYMKGEYASFIKGHDKAVRTRNERQIAIQPTDPDIRNITLTRGKVTVVSKEKYDSLMRWNWNAIKPNPKSDIWYAVRHRRDTEEPGLSMIYMHEVIAQPKDGLIADHIDGDGLNNRDTNLREVTHRENLHNTKMNKNNTSGVKGVGWFKPKQMWCAKIMVYGRSIHLGYFREEDFDKAVAARRAAESKYYGEHVRK